MITYCITILYLTACTCFASPRRDIDTQNVVTVPTNCPPGQAWINGACRDVWRSVDAAPANVITVPTNCPPGQAWINGACRDIWRSVDAAPTNVVTVPTNCPDGQEWVNGACRDVWNKSFTAAPANVVTVPINCPSGQAWINGACRDVWRSVDAAPANVVTVPTNCPPGQAWINGACRDIWRRILSQQNTELSHDLDELFDDIRKALLRSEKQMENIKISDEPVDGKHIISVPNQCPIGYRPDALGVCRPILNL